MRSLRVILSVTTALLLLAGYLASQYCYLFTGDISLYVAKVNAQPIRTLALVIFLAAIVLAFIPQQEES